MIPAWSTSVREGEAAGSRRAAHRSQPGLPCQACSVSSTVPSAYLGWEPVPCGSRSTSITPVPPLASTSPWRAPAPGQHQPTCVREHDPCAACSAGFVCKHFHCASPWRGPVCRGQAAPWDGVCVRPCTPKDARIPAALVRAALRDGQGQGQGRVCVCVCRGTCAAQCPQQAGTGSGWLSAGSGAEDGEQPDKAELSPWVRSR